jgi:hypothetical protein
MSGVIDKYWMSIYSLLACFLNEVSLYLQVVSLYFFKYSDTAKLKFGLQAKAKALDSKPKLKLWTPTKALESSQS